MPHSAQHRESLHSLLNAAVAILGGEPSRSVPAFEAIWQSGTQPRRFFHNVTHYASVAGAEVALQRKQLGLAPFETSVSALRFIAGLCHDVAYVHVDAKADKASDGFAPHIRQQLETLVTLQPHESGNVLLRLHTHVAQDSLIQAVLHLFGIKPEDDAVQLQWYHNQNEFLSALFAVAAGRSMGLQDAQLLAIAALIEATVPFGSPARLLALKDRLLHANAMLAEALPAEEMEALIASAEQMANQDVGDFEKHFADFVLNSQRLLLENCAGTAQGNAADCISPVHLATAMSGMADFLMSIADASAQNPPTRSIFHKANGARHPMEAQAITNIHTLYGYLREASSDLQLLVADYMNHHGIAPVHWRTLAAHCCRAHGGLAAEKLTVDALFSLLGAAHLMENTQSACNDTQRINTYLLQLKATAAETGNISTQTQPIC
jgi:hypothetical protein